MTTRITYDSWMSISNDILRTYLFSYLCFKYKSYYLQLVNTFEPVMVSNMTSGDKWKYDDHNWSDRVKL